MQKHFFPNSIFIFTEIEDYLLSENYSVLADISKQHIPRQNS